MSITWRAMLQKHTVTPWKIVFQHEDDKCTLLSINNMTTISCLGLMGYSYDKGSSTTSGEIKAVVPIYVKASYYLHTLKAQHWKLACIT